MMMLDFVIVGICRQVMIDMRIHDNDAFFRNQLTEFSTETLSRLSTVLHTGKKLKFFIFEYRLSTIMIFNAQGAQLPRRGRPGYTTGSTATSFILLIIVATSDMFRCKRCLATSTTTSRWLPRTCGGWTSSTGRLLARFGIQSTPSPSPSSSSPGLAHHQQPSSIGPCEHQRRSEVHREELS